MIKKQQCADLSLFLTIKILKNHLSINNKWKKRGDLNSILKEDY